MAEQVRSSEGTNANTFLCSQRKISLRTVDCGIRTMNGVSHVHITGCTLGAKRKLDIKVTDNEKGE